MEDRKPNKAGRLYKISKGARNGLIIRDCTATIKVTEPKGVRKVELEENDSLDLALPGAAKPLTLTFKAVTPDRDLKFECTRANKTWELLLPAPPE